MNLYNKLLLLFVISVALLPVTAFTQTAPANCDPPALIPVRVGNKWGYCDKEMKMKIPAAYDSAGPFQEVAYLPNTIKTGSSQYATVKKSGKCYRINADGKLNPQVLACSSIYVPPMVIMREDAKFEINNENGLYGVKSIESGSYIVLPQYDAIIPFDSDLSGSYPYVVKQNGKYGVFAGSGKALLPAIYDKIEYASFFWYNVELMLVTHGNESFYVDYCGNEYRKNQ